MESIVSSAWICPVCGYVHRGPEPPTECPICGSPKADFQPHVEEKPVAAPVRRQWRCLICSHVHIGPQPPEACPVCGAGASDFESISAQESPEEVRGFTGNIVIVGAGIAGLSAAESARAAAPDAEITLISKEAELPYYRLNLTRRLASEIDEAQLPIHPAEWYSESRVRLVRGAEVSALALERHAVEILGGDEFAFDKLILACGAHPFVPPIPGADRAGVHVLRTVQDARTLEQTVKPGAPCVCIGGGILGLETAAALARRGARITLLETFPWLLPRQLDREGAAVLERFVAGLGIKVLLPAAVSSIEGEAAVRAVSLADGSSLPAELVVITAGVRPNTHLARRAGLEVNQGVVVDSCLAASLPDVYAAGDVAEHRGVLYGTWEPARFQGSIAGANAGGSHIEFGGIPRANTLKVLGVSLFSVGEVEAKDGSYQAISCERDGSYARFLFRDSRLAGVILIGDTRLAAASAQCVKERADASGVLELHPNADEVGRWLQGRVS